MAQHALNPAYRRVEVDEFLAMDFGGARAELEDGVIQMMAVGNEADARIAANIIAFLLPGLRGTGCRPYGSDFATRTEERTVRMPDVGVYCDHPSKPENATRKLIGVPQIVFDVLSPSTASHDQLVKLAEYRELSGVREIVFVDPLTERVRLLARSSIGEWSDDRMEQGKNLRLPSLDLVIPHSESFAAD